MFRLPKLYLLEAIGPYLQIDWSFHYGLLDVYLFILNLFRMSFYGACLLPSHLIRHCQESYHSCKNRPFIVKVKINFKYF